jgi:aspartyl-tRNA(Asn)/glutamyl-tRNA(Gln) amidotransferase subunit B
VSRRPDQAVSAGASAKRAVNFMLGRLAATANEKGCSIAEVGISSTQLGELAKLTDEGKINATAADKVLESMIAKGGEPLDIAKELNLPAQE